jgi:enoyl-CoA hydratase/carnithine racemase
MTYKLIDLAVQSGIATLTFNRPDKRNAMSDDMRTEFTDALESVAADKAIRALVLTGAGKGFSAGGDIAGMERRMQAPTGEIAFNGWHRQQRVHHTQSLLHTLPKPTIAAVNGAAAGLGADTALACDFIIASEWASFSWSYIHRGIIPDGGGMYFLPRRVALAKAQEPIFTGRKVNADEALALGIAVARPAPIRRSRMRRLEPPSSPRIRHCLALSRPSSIRHLNRRRIRSSRRVARRKASATRAPSTANR